MKSSIVWPIIKLPIEGINVKEIEPIVWMTLQNLIKYQLDTSCGQNKLLPSKETKESQLWAREQELIHAKEVHVI